MSDSTMTVNINAEKCCVNEDGVLHCLDGPAVKWHDGREAWYKNGLLHRIDGPAIECTNGAKHWCQNGLLHRIDGPAVEYPNGYVVWYIDGDCHGSGLEGFWALWELLNETQRQNVNLHMWLAKLTD